MWIRHLGTNTGWVRPRRLFQAVTPDVCSRSTPTTGAPRWRANIREPPGPSPPRWRVQCRFKGLSGPVGPSGVGGCTCGFNDLQGGFAGDGGRVHYLPPRLPTAECSVCCTVAALAVSGSGIIPLAVHESGCERTPPPNRAGIRAFLRGSIPGSPTKTRGNGEFELAANRVQAVHYRCEVIVVVETRPSERMRRRGTESRPTTRGEYESTRRLEILR